VKTLARGLAILLVVVGSAFEAWPDIYSFEDEQGVVHFTNVPVDGRYRFKEKENLRKFKVFIYESNERQYDPIIRRVAGEEGLDPDLLRSLVSVESNFDPVAISPKGAMGLTQLMPETARSLGVDNVFHPEQNLGAGAKHLRALLDKYDGDLALALAAYNAGEKAVEIYQGIPPYPETEMYVREVLRRYRKAKERSVKADGAAGEPP
jgi:soluble lytic murein transglycosylase-like protein